MSRNSRMSGKYGDDEDYQQLAVREGEERRHHDVDSVPSTSPASVVELNSHIEEKKEAGRGGKKKKRKKENKSNEVSKNTRLAPIVAPEHIFAEVAPDEGIRPPLSDRKIKKKTTRPSSMLSPPSLELSSFPQHAEVQEPPRRSRNDRASTKVTRPGAVAVHHEPAAADTQSGQGGLARAPSVAAARRRESDRISEKKKGNGRANASDDANAKELARASSGVAALRSSTISKSEGKQLSRATPGANAMSAKITEGSKGIPEAFDDSEPRSRDFSVRASARKTGGKAIPEIISESEPRSEDAFVRSNAKGTKNKARPEIYGDSEPRSDDSSFSRSIGKETMESSALCLDTSIVSPPVAPLPISRSGRSMQGQVEQVQVQELRAPNAAATPGALRVAGEHTAVATDDENEFMDDATFTSYPPAVSALPAATIVVEEEEPSVIDGEIQEALPATIPEEPSVRKGIAGWIERHWVMSLIIILVAVGAIIGGLVGGLTGSGSSQASTLAPSAAPTTEAYGNVFSVVSQLTLPTVLQDPTTPQYAALAWMVEQDTFKTLDEAKILQRFALATLYYSMEGDGWNKQVNFLSDMDECNWIDNRNATGVRCDDDEAVIEIFLDQTNLKGFIPSELSTLTSLLYLGMSDNELTGTIPPNFFTLGSVQDIFLFDNLLSGSLPTNIGDMTQLSLLRIQRNRLTGTLPSSIGNLQFLAQLSTQENQFSGPIPRSMGQLANLVVWFNEGNQMTGQVPSEVSGMSSLTNVYLNNNLFTGTMEPFCRNATRLSTFHADCYSSITFQISPEVLCPCCSTCCDDRQGCVSAESIGS